MKAYKLWCRKDRNHVFYIQFAHTPGKWISSNCSNRDDAIRWAETKKDGAIRVHRKIPTLSEFSSGFFLPGNELWMKRLKRKKKTFASDYFKAHQGRLDNYILPEFGARLIISISTIEIDNWFLDLRSVKTGNELSDNAKNKILHAFRILLEEAKYQGYVKDNVAAAVEEIHEENKERQHFDELEMQKLFPDNREELLRIWQGLKWTVFFMIMRDTGFRPGEVAGLTRGAYYRLNLIVVQQLLN